MKIFDGHIHLDDSYDVDNLLFDMKLNNVSGAIVMPNPIDPDIFSPSQTDVSLSGKRVKFTRDGKHFYFEHAKEQKLNGGDISPDYFYNLNKTLIEKCQDVDTIFPFVLLPCNLELANETLERIEHDYKGKFFGIKFHPNSYSFAINKAGFNPKNFPYKYPVIIHTGISQYDRPDYALKFAQQYQGNVCLAHCARFDEQVLQKIKQMPNVYIDISPSYYLSRVSNGQTQKVYDGDSLKGKTEEELITHLIDVVGEDKILAGSDAPFGSIQELKELAETLPISEKLKQKIFVDNVSTFNSFAQHSEMQKGQPLTIAEQPRTPSL